MRKLAVADAFVDNARAASSEAELFDLLSDCCDAVGIRYFALVHHIDFGVDAAPAVRLHNYLKAWQHWFDESRLGRSDPVHRASQLANYGFPWSAIPGMIMPTLADLSVFAQARINMGMIAKSQLRSFDWSRGRTWAKGSFRDRRSAICAARSGAFKTFNRGAIQCCHNTNRQSPVSHGHELLAAPVWRNMAMCDEIRGLMLPA